MQFYDKNKLPFFYHHYSRIWRGPNSILYIYLILFFFSYLLIMSPPLLLPHYPCRSCSSMTVVSYPILPLELILLIWQDPVSSLFAFQLTYSITSGFISNLHQWSISRSSWLFLVWDYAHTLRSDSTNGFCWGKYDTSILFLCYHFFYLLY